MQWWEYDANPKVKHTMKAIPAIIMWELWKKRNANRHDKEVSFDKMYTQCQSTVHMLIRVTYLWLRNIPYHWSGMLDLLRQYKPVLHYHIVKWLTPEERWIKCNTDGASKGNPGENSYGFCIRRSQGDLVYAEAQKIGNTTNIEEEITAIWKALSCCKRGGITNVKFTKSLEYDSKRMDGTLELNRKDIGDT
ncbi:hypothetical protein KY290_005357 [Solanum tuberosum]|uniref:RNase H type-1 domain-containing protein n=1 Tax=Solanum tuberosum TaxID=4113 RepID=A0ABQ7WDX1_SOLTU|nr:hypothetical protein KY289_005749 [Solanum tuberosum]KAH0778930.1 hypothetical protein KY290_005357 [Solanum tuberosum]